MGGGAGNALSSLVVYDKQNSASFSHKIFLLDDPESDKYIRVCEDAGVSVLRKDMLPDITNELLVADVVILHWWNHPEMASFLAEFPQIAVRLVVWAHVNGCNYPCIPFEFTQIPHQVFFTSPFSLENSLWDSKQRDYVTRNSSVVYGLGKLNSYSNLHINPPPSKKKFIIGYVGTLNLSKIHPQFIDICHEILKVIPNALFVIVGDKSHADPLLARAEALGISGSFDFTGYEEQIVVQLAKFDVFAYPLNTNHFGTTENALLEAMAFGLPVIAMNHNSEKYIIKDHKEIGFLADSVEHFLECVKFLYDHPSERMRVGNNAKEFIRKNYTLKKNMCDLHMQLTKVLDLDKKIIDFKSFCGESPYQWFMTFLGVDRVFFEGSINSSNNNRKSFYEEKIKCSSPILREKNKSSIRHFSKHFPEDEILKYWNDLICS